jgi:leucyl-tRNA synthetase
MELVNFIYKSIQEPIVRKEIFKEAVDTVFLLLSPFTPHISEEANQILGNNDTILKRNWPRYKEEFLKEEQVEIAVLVNGRVRDRIMINVDWSQDQIKEKVLSLEKIKNTLGNRPLKKFIYIEKRIVNLVV